MLCSMSCQGFRFSAASPVSSFGLEQVFSDLLARNLDSIIGPHCLGGSFSVQSDKAVVSST